MTTEQLTLSRVLRFWAPLAGTWLMMAVEGPLLTAVIARLTAPTYNLAAFGVVYSVALLAEAPVIMMLSAATALVRNRDSYQRLRRFMLALNIAVSLGLAVTVVPAVFGLLAGGVLGLDVEVAQRAHVALCVLLPWPAAIGYRRFYQGIIIRFGATRRVAYGTVLRLVVMATTTGVLTASHRVEGVVVGAGALAAGVCAEAIASRFMAAPALRHVLADTKHSPESLSMRKIMVLYTPLALTSLIGLAIQPMVTFFMGHSRAPLESLAVLPVVNSLVFVFRSVGLAAQEVFIALAGDAWEGVRMLRRFARLLAFAAAGILAAIAWSPLAGIWFVKVSGLEPSLAAYAIWPTRILALMPALTVWLSWQRAMHVNHRHTAPVSWATATELCCAAAVLFLAVTLGGMVGVLAAAIALVAGRITANLLLTLTLGRLRRDPC